MPGMPMNGRPRLGRPRPPLRRAPFLGKWSARVTWQDFGSVRELPVGRSWRDQKGSGSSGRGTGGDHEMPLSCAGKSSNGASY